MRFAAARAYLQFRLDCDRLSFQMLRKRTALSPVASRPVFVLQVLIQLLQLFFLFWCKAILIGAEQLFAKLINLSLRLG
jgi:hypothetical protein